MYIQISQTIDSQLRAYNTLELEKLLETVLVRDVYVKYFAGLVKPMFGTGLFKIETNGKLTLVDSNWDTSD